MTRREKLLNFITGGAIERIAARYEASVWNASRSWLPAYIQSVREDINAMTRQEVLRRVRYFEKNSNTMRKTLSILNVNVVGTGINPTPATSREAWNKKALDWWNTWALVADATGESTIPELQGMAYDAENIDGDCGLRLLETPLGRPAIDLVESHRIGGGGSNREKLAAMGYKDIDGVVVDVATGRRVAYNVANDFDGSLVDTIPASSFVFFFRKRRAGQYRGISLFHAAILDLHDLDDLQKYEMLAAKDAASVSKVVTLAAGDATVEQAIGKSLQPKPSSAALSDLQAYYRKATGGETIVARPGDKYDQHVSERPSAATSGFWDKLENKFVQGSGLSYAALVDYKGGWTGAPLRAAVTSDNRLFALRTTEQARRWQKVWEFAIGWAMSHGELEFNPDFRCVRWHPPRRTTVDIGNESAAQINELRTGIRTFEMIHGEAGDDWRDRLEQRAIEERFISDLAVKYGIERTLISSFAQERVTLTAAGTAQEAGAGEDDGDGNDAEDAADAKKDSTSP